MQFVGLTSKQANEQRKKFGLNEIVQAKKISIAKDFLSRFKNPLLIILIIGSFIAGFLGDKITASIIIFIVFVSVIIDFVNTYRSQKAADDLKKRVMITTTVLRDGQEKELPLSLVVPDDIIVLHAGDLVPADGEIVEGNDLFINESQLTGESFPVEKRVGEEVFLGSSVSTGKALMHVKATGKNTKFSHLAESLIRTNPTTEFDRGIKEFSSLVVKATLFLVLIIFFINALLKHDIVDSFLFTVALAVGLTPELLPMIIALNLSKGSLKMAKRGVIVKKLSSIQNFGNMDIFCTDKTGTLTEDKIELVKYVDCDGNDSEEVLVAAYVNSFFSSSLHNALDIAIRDYKHFDTNGFKKIDELPFDYERRRDSIVVQKDDKNYFISKGVPEQVLKVCKTFGREEQSFSDEVLKKINDEYEALSNDGFRVLGIAQKVLPKEDKTYSIHDESEMNFLGFIAFLDPPKKDVAETLRSLEHYGVEIKILTGDNDLVTKKIAKEINLPVKGVLLGSEIEKMSDEHLANVVESITIFARVLPEQKEKIIRILRAKGHVVGYLGDGINDAPSLKQADVGISVNNAVDVAKDTADIILLKKSLHDLISGVLEGRKTFSNTLKYLKMSLSSNFGNMFSMAGASLVLPFLPMTASQILLNNLLYDSSQFAIPSDNVDESNIIRPKKFDIKFLKRFMIVFGSLSSVFDFLTFFVLYSVFSLVGGAFQTGWFLESIATQTFVVYIIRTRKIPFLQSRPSIFIFGSTILAAMLAWVIALSNTGKLFGFANLTPHQIFAILIIIISYLVFAEFLKHFFYKKLVNKDHDL